MSDPNFASVLDRPADTIKRPPPYPMGHYLAVVDGTPARREVGQNKTPAWDFNLKILQPQADVLESEAFQQFNAEVPDGIAGKTIRHTLFETDQAAWRMKQFLAEHLMIDSSGKTMRQMLAEAPGRQVIVEISHRPSEDGTETYTQVKSTAAV